RRREAFDGRAAGAGRGRVVRIGRPRTHAQRRWCVIDAPAACGGFVDGFVCMSEIDVVPLPTRLWPGRLIGQTVVVFDVLRATTTITAALSAGVAEVHLFAEIADARKAAAAQADRPILMGERDCLPPSG